MVRWNRMHLACSTLAAWIVAGCHAPTVFECSTAADCDRGTDGRCERTNVCSYADGMCPSGRRYGDHAGAAAAECVTASPDAGLLAYWPLDGDGTDATGNGHDATLVASPAVVAGHLGMAYQFDGTTQMMSAATLEGAAFPVTGTLSLWLESTLDQQGSVFDYHTDSRNHLFLRLVPAPQRLQVASQSATYDALVEVPVTAGTAAWHHLAITWDTTTAPILRLYLDGTLGGSDTIENGWTPFQQSVELMHFFAGKLDEVKLYDHVLSQQEIAALP